MNQTIFWATVFLAVTAVNVTGADEKEKVFTDPAQAGRDYEIQGEYVIAIKTPQVDEKYGVQIVALGGGEFIATRMHGGLPGAGAQPTRRIRFLEGHTADGSTTFVERQTVVTFAKDGSTTVKNSAFNVEVAKLEKQVRTSPTLGAKPTPGATVLFDGTNTAPFDNAQMTADGFLKAGAVTKEKFGDFTLHLEFRVPFMPFARGIDRGHGGILLQDQYELLISDSFGMATPQEDCGGAIAKVRAPDLNMCFPPLAWQTLDVDFTARRFDKSGNTSQPASVTVKQNGVVIQQDVKLSAGTPPEGSNKQTVESGPINFKSYGSPVCFRNVWLVKR